MEYQPQKQYRVDRLASAMAAGDPMEAVNEHILAGHPVTEIASATKGSAWRFVITNSGTCIELETIDNLVDQWSAAVERLSEAAARLVVHEMDLPDRLATLLQIRIQTEVAHIANDFCLVESRCQRFFRPEDNDRVAGLPEIDAVLAEVGFRWNGGDMVQEIWSDEHKRKFEEALSKAKSRGLIQNYTEIRREYS